jgi:hypothetical protein
LNPAEQALRELAMKHRLIVLTIASSVALLSAPSSAQMHGSGITFPASGLGQGVEVSPGFGLRGWIGGRPGQLGSDSAMASSMVLADWHPWASGFRLTGGLSQSSPRLDSRYSLNGAGLDPASAIGLDARSWLARGNPYLGVGWGVGLHQRSGLYLSADLGVMYQRSSLSTWGCPGGLASGPCAPDVRALDVPSADEMRIAPMMSFGIGLRF